MDEKLASECVLIDAPIGGEIKAQKTDPAWAFSARDRGSSQGEALSLASSNACLWRRMNVTMEWFDQYHSVTSRRE